MAKRRWLTPDIVIEKAAAMADEAKQFETVTLTAVAAALDVRVPSLYNHVANLEDLHHGMAVYGTHLLLADLRAATVGQIGRAALLAMAAAYRQFVQAHPGLYPLTIRAPEPDDPVLTALAQEMVQLLQLVLASFWPARRRRHPRHSRAARHPPRLQHPGSGRRLQTTAGPG
ncbi:MAG: TetR/AcrR family transcriptional regulator [Chloroflexi bacterium]|nr:TetR/AcrR family transcriptional regulator [Chloroflexota bacterium]